MAELVCCTASAATPKKDNYAGDETQNKRGVSTVNQVFHRARCCHELGRHRGELWHHIFFHELWVVPEEHPIVLTDAPVNSKTNRECMTQIMFEMFNVPAMYAAIQAVFSSLRFVTHVGLLDGLWRRCAAHCSHQRGVAKPLSLSVETYGTEMGSLLADDITHVLKIEFDCRLRAEVPRDGCVLLSWTRALHQGGSQIRRVGKLLAPVRRYSVRIGGSCSRRSACAPWTWRCKLFLSLFALRRTTANVMADELRVAPENIPSCSEKPLPTKSSRSRPCSRRSTCAPWTWRCKLFCPLCASRRRSSIELHSGHGVSHTDCFVQSFV